MKRKNSSIKYQMPFKTAIKPLVLLTALGMASSVYALPSPFTTIPLHLQNTTTTSGQGVPPNVLVQFDDSGSMLWVPEANCKPNETCPNGKYYTGKNRMEIARSALQKIVSKKEYVTDVNWGLITLNGNEKDNHLGWSTRDYAEKFVSGSRKNFALDPVTELKPLVDKLWASKGTPAVERYLDAMHILRKALNKDGAYRCQKSYIIVFSDGDADGFLAAPTVSGTSFTPSTDGYFHYRANLHYPQIHETWVAHNSPFTYSLAQASRFTSKPAALFPGWSTPPLLTKNGNNYSWNITRINGNPKRKDALVDANGKIQYDFGGFMKYESLPLAESWGGHPDALPLLANLAYYTDLKTGGTDAAGKSWDDTTPDKDGGNSNQMQNIHTYAIGFGVGVSDAGRYALAQMSTGNNFNALNASNEQELLSAFERIFAKIKSENKIIPPASIATIAPSLSFEDTVTQVPTAAASIHLDLASGSSEIRFYQITPSGNNYGADGNYTTPDFSQRKVLINEGGTGNRVSWLNNFSKNNDFFDLVSQNGNEWKDALIPWIARSKSDSVIATMPNNSIKYRVRDESGTPNKRNMGDVIGASLYPVGELVNKRERYLITAANDGMVYLFESMNSSTNPYTLKLNYIPAGMQRENATDTMAKHFKYIADKDYLTTENKPHQYMINGDFTVRTTEKNYPKRIFMSGNMGQGGRGSYSLNIGGVEAKNASKKVGIAASSTEWATTVPLFETEKQGNSMGYTIGAPQIGRLSANRQITFGTGTVSQQTDLHNVYYATFVNSGIRNPNSVANGIDNTESALYVYSTLGGENVGLRNGGHKEKLSYTVGQRVNKIIANQHGGGLAQATLVDTDFDGVIDVAYAGSYQGHMYRFDFRDTNNWNAKLIFKTPNNQPITSAPAVYRNDANNYIVIFGTGSDVYQTDLDDTSVQSVYGIYDDLTNQNPQPVQKSQLLQQHLLQAGSVSGYKTRDLTNTAINTNSHKGWYFDLVLNNAKLGERVVVKPSMLLKTVLLTTRIYSKDNTGSVSEDLCLASKSTKSTKSSSWIMQFRADTGGKLPASAENGEDVGLFAYVDFANANTDGKSKTRHEQSMTAGYQVDGGGVFSYALLFGGIDPSQPCNRGSAYSCSGDAGTSGEDIPINPTPIVPRECIARGSKNLLIGSNSTDVNSSGINTSVAIYAKECQTASIRRISWREIF